MLYAVLYVCVVLLAFFVMLMADDGSDDDEMVPIWVLMALVWPLMLVGALLALPFGLVYALVKYIKRKRGDK